MSFEIAFEKPYKYDAGSQYILDANDVIILNVQGYVHLSKVLNCKADTAQDEFGEYVAKILNEYDDLIKALNRFITFAKKETHLNSGTVMFSSERNEYKDLIELLTKLNVYKT